MLRIQIIGLAIVAALAMSAVAAGSASAALLFLSSKTGLLLGSLVGGPHKFVTESGTVECTTANADGAITSTGSEVQLALVTYGNCNVTKPLSLSATVTPADYLFFTNGNVTLDNTVTINAGSGLCIITVKPQSLTGVSYKNIAGPPMELEVIAAVKNITYSQKGALCPGGEKTFTNGTYSGTELVKEDGGEILID